jgi:hypothetical protein
MGIIKAFCLGAVVCLALEGSANAFCFEEAGAEYGINPQILRAIAKVESNFNPKAINKNSNGTFDVGLMQINSSWASTLGKERWNALGDACSNTKTGAWILSMCMNKYGYTWKAIGCYNSQTPGKRDRYSKMVFDQLQRVKPLAQEAAYTPINKDKLEGLVRDKVDDWVAGAVQGKGQEFVVKVPAMGSVPKAPSQEPPTQTDSALQNALPGLAASQNPLTLGTDAEEANAEAGQLFSSAPSINSAN